MRLVLASVLAALSVACEPAKQSGEGGGSTPTTPTPMPSGPTAPTATDLIFCVNETNRYRTSNGRPEVIRSPALEAFAAEGAREDAGSAAAHQHFNRTNGGGVAFAENEFHRTSTAFFTSTRDAIAQFVMAFYAEGSGGGHYQNLMGAYTQVGCGVFLANGEITFVQDFR